MRMWRWFAGGLLGAGALTAAFFAAAPGDPVVRTVALGAFPSALALDARTGRVFVVSHRALTVRVLDSASGTLVRSIPLPASGPFVGPQAVAVDATHGRLFIDTDTGQIYLLDARDGRVLRAVSVAGAGETLAGLAVDERTAHVFVADPNANVVYVLDARDGRVLRTVAVAQDPTNVVVDERTGRAFVAT